MDPAVLGPRARRRTRTASVHGFRLAWVGGLLLALLVITQPLAAVPASAITVGPGVTFQPSGSWSNLSFAATQSFTTIRVDATGVTFDTVRFGMAKSPASLPRAGLVMNAWSPLQTTANGTVLDFTGDAPSGASLLFSLSSVIPAHEYVFQVDGTEISRPLSNQTGFVSFTWSSFSTHDFKVLLGWRTGLPPPPTPLSADFTFAPSNPGSGQPVAFNAAAAGGFPPYVYSWQFGDGATASGANASHAYASGGNYTVALTVADVSGATASASHVVAVQPIAPPPTLSVSLVFSPTHPQVGEVVTFSSAVSGGTPPFAYSWAFGDAATATSASPTHAYAAVGSYVVDLTVQDAVSATARATARVNVTAVPPPVPGNVTAAFDFTVNGATVSFVDRSTSDASLPIVRRSWFLGDGSVANGTSPVHVYALSGLTASYTVWLTAYDSAGHVGTTARVVTLVNWPLIFLILIAVAAVVIILVLVLRRRRKRKESKRSSTRRNRVPPSE